MKRILLVIYITLITPISILSQNLSAYGVSLGDAKYEVENTLENKGEDIKYSINKLGEPLLKISHPNVGGVSFDEGTFRFNNDEKLCHISFFSYDPYGIGTPGMPWEAEFYRKATECKNAYLKMYQNLKLKYGTPDISSNTTVMWQIGKQRITLEYEYQYEYNQYGSIDHHVDVTLKYSLIDVNNVDY